MAQHYRLPEAMSDLLLEMRHVRASDAEAVHVLLQSDHVNRGTMRLSIESLSMVTGRIAETPGATKIVAVRGGAVAGYAELIRYPKLPRHWHCADINLIATHPGHRGKGVGHALLQQMVDLADKWLQIVRLLFVARAGNRRAIALYEAFGFAIEGRMPGYVFLDGAYEDALVMRRLRPFADRIADRGEG